MIGMNATTGRTLSGEAHLSQSITRILTTPWGSRLMRRDFGSELLNLIDAPNHNMTRTQLYAAIATALMRWEPRVRLVQLQWIEADGASGAPILEIEAVTTETGEATRLTVPVKSGPMR